MAMAPTGKPELTKSKAFALLQSSMAWWSGCPGVSRTHALQRLPLASFDQTDRMDMSTDCAGLMLCRQLKSMNWIKTWMLVCFDGIFFFFWLRCFLEIKLEPAPNLQLLGALLFEFSLFCCFYLLTCLINFVSELLSFLFLTLLPCLKNKNLYSSEDQLALEFKINA